MDAKEQVRLWAIEDKSVHNNDIPWLKGGECCPDFSCCKPELLAPKEVRMLFYKADMEGDTKTTSRLLGEFLSRLIEFAVPKKKVHIAGLTEQRMELE
jgi:hypothetical protein